MTKTKSTPNQIKAKLGLHGVSDVDTAKALMTAYERLLNNPKFPTPPVDLPTYKAGIDQYSALIIDAEDGGKRAKSAMNKQRGVVIKMYTQLGHYVEAACNDDLATFITSGFTQAVKTKTAPVKLTEFHFASERSFMRVIRMYFSANGRVGFIQIKDADFRRSRVQ
jgi:hypothetical protein